MTTTTFAPALVAAPAAARVTLRARLAAAIRGLPDFDAYSAIEACLGLAAMGCASALLIAAL